MINISRRTLLAALGAAGLIAAVPGCGTGGTSSSAAGTFSYRLRDQYGVWLKDLKWFPVLQQRTGITVNIIDGGPADQYYQKLDLALASGGVEDLLIANGSQADIYGGQGAFADLTGPIAEHAPAINAYLDANPDYRSLSTTDGKIFGLAQETVKISNVTFYRKDMVDKAGITALPTNVDELADTLQTLKDTYASTRNFYPFTGRETFLRFPYAFEANFAVTDGKVNGIAEDTIGALTSAGYRAMVEWYREVYAAGLIDPEFVQGASTEESWQTKMLTGLGAVSDDFFTRPTWFMQNGGPKNDPDYDTAVLQPFTSVSGKPLTVPAGPRWDATRCMTINAKASPDTVASVLKLLDYLYTPEGQLLMHYGVEGESYRMDGGKPVYTVTFDDEGNKGDGVPVWNFLQDRLTFVAPVDNAAYLQWLDERTRSFAVDYFGKHIEQRPTLKYDVNQQKQRSDLLAALEPYVVAQVTAFVTGARPMGEWDAFLGEADQKGYSTVVGIEQAAFDAANS